MRRSRVVTVMKNGHIHLQIDKHYYSVQYAYISKKVRVIYSTSNVEIFYKYELIAAHARQRKAHNYTTDAAHLASQHQAMSEWSADFFLAKAKLISPEVEQYIAQVLMKKQHPEQAYKTCQGILSFAPRVGHHRLSQACQRAHAYRLYHYRAIESILNKGLDLQPDDDQEQLTMPTHENIRGKDYYQQSTD